MAETTFVDIKDQQELDGVFASSHEHPQLLFLHDPHCPISARALRQVEQLGGDVPRIDVSRQHALSRAVAERTGVRHESPQAFVLRDGKPVWNASHSAIKLETFAPLLGTGNE